MKVEIYPEDSHIEDMEYVAKKLGVSLEKFQEIVNMPNKTYEDYNNNQWLFKLGFKIRNKLK